MSGSVSPSLAPFPAAWSSFFIAIAEVAATLAGLSFVAVSAHASILRAAPTRYKAQHTLLTFVVVLVGALILAMPQQPAVAATTVVWWSSVAGAALTITSIVRESQSRHPPDWLRIARSLNSVEFLLAYGVAGIWALLHLEPDAQPLNPHAAAQPARGGLGHDPGAGLVGGADVAAAAGGRASPLARRAPGCSEPGRTASSAGAARRARGAGAGRRRPAPGRATMRHEAPT